MGARAAFDAPTSVAGDAIAELPITEGDEPAAAKSECKGDTPLVILKDKDHFAEMWQSLSSVRSAYSDAVHRTWASAGLELFGHGPDKDTMGKEPSARDPFEEMSSYVT